MMKASFWSLRKDALELYDSMAHLADEFGWEIFNEEGLVRCEAYGILDDAYRAADTKEELATYIAGEIIGLEKDIKEARENGSPENLEDAEHNVRIVKYLVKYVQHNIEEHIWEVHEEFLPIYTRGW